MLLTSDLRWARLIPREALNFGRLKSKDRRAPLHVAVITGIEDVPVSLNGKKFFLGNYGRLFEAARLGSVEALLEVLVDDPLILERVPLTQDTPLHVAVLAGKAEFAKEILRQWQRLALELNQDGFSPIHITAINGDIELDRDGRTPIHLAAVKGRLDVMVELLSTCPELAREVTVQGETIFHLVVKSNQFEAFKVLLEKVGFHYLLSFKDQDGNIILHLASAENKSR
ncbi:hypothetical protein Scep_026508 [Stephania cephalantha]|uniref:Ankyrin repeat-containing protein BDA1-like n=1 Tax=Stephania cephalantha TaxID=152367 RepID=A0AAP0HQH0_9MAGN